jgi:hypothetical protein
MFGRHLITHPDHDFRPASDHTGASPGKVEGFSAMVGALAAARTDRRDRRDKACKPSIEALPGFREAEANSVTQHRPSKLSGGSRMRISVRPKRGAPRYTRADIVLGAVNSAVTL